LLLPITIILHVTFIYVLPYTLHTVFQSLAGTVAALIGSGIVVQNIPYKDGFGAKQLALLAHTTILGAVVAPVCFIGGPLIIRAAW